MVCTGCGGEGDNAVENGYEICTACNGTGEVCDNCGEAIDDCDGMCDVDDEDNSWEEYDSDLEDDYEEEKHYGDE